MRQRLFISFFLLSLCLGLNAQSVLDGYIQDALESNIALKQKEYSYQKSLEAMKETRRMFFPVVSIEAKYSKSQGGRTIEIPFGDMMNPVFDNLNAINQIITPLQPEYSSPGAYPTIDNYTINMLREQGQETKIQLPMPLFNAAIIQNHKIRIGLAEAERINVEIYKRELVKEVKSVYIKYLEAQQVMDMYQITYMIVKKNPQSRESLLKYDKITKDEVYADRA